MNTGLGLFKPGGLAAILLHLSLITYQVTQCLLHQPLKKKKKTLEIQGDCTANRGRSKLILGEGWRRK